MKGSEPCVPRSDSFVLSFEVNGEDVFIFLQSSQSFD